jgi:hypothetical protein
MERSSIIAEKAQPGSCDAMLASFEDVNVNKEPPNRANIRQSPPVIAADI